MSQATPYKVFVHLSEARSFLGLSDNHMSDAFAVIRIGPTNRMQRKTEVKVETVNAVWEAKFLFEDVMLTEEEFRKEKLSISVYDRNVFSRNELIGSHEFSLTNIMRQKSGQYDRKWFSLTLPDQPGHNRGFMRLTTFVLRPGSEIPHQDEANDDAVDEEKAIMGDPLIESRTPYVLNMLIYRGHHILSNSKLPLGGSLNPFVVVRFNGNVAQTSSAFNTSAPVWNMKLVLPFNMPLTSESIEVQLWNSVNKRPAQLIAEETFNYYNQGLTHKAWGPRWVNLYSSEYDSQRVSALGAIKNSLDVSGRANPLRAEYVGRLLCRMSVTPTDRTNQRLLVMSCNPVAMPPTVEYCLDLLLYSSMEIPVMGGQIRVEVVFGDKRAESSRRLGKDGVFSWMETMQPVIGKHDKPPEADDPMRLSLRIHGPADVEQLHDIVISVFHCVGTSTRKISFLRLKPVNMLPGGKLDTYFVNGQYAIPKKGMLSQRALHDMWGPRWYTLNHVRPDNDNPQLVAGFLLMSIGFGISAVRPPAVPRPIRRPHVRYTLRCYLYHGANLLTADSATVTTNPFLVVRFGDASYRTRTIKDSTFPFWCEWADLGPIEADRENPPSIFLQLYHQTQLQYKLIGRTDILGRHALANASAGEVYRYLLYYDPHETQDDEAHGSAADASAGLLTSSSLSPSSAVVPSAGAAGSNVRVTRGGGDPEKAPYVLACFQLLPYIADRPKRLQRFPIKRDWLPQPGETVDGIEVTAGTGETGPSDHSRMGRKRRVKAMRAAAAAGAAAAGEAVEGTEQDVILLRRAYNMDDAEHSDDSLSDDDDEDALWAATGTNGAGSGSGSDTAAAAGTRRGRGKGSSTAMVPRRTQRSTAIEDDEEEALLAAARRGNVHTFTGENPKHVWWRPQTSEFACKLEVVGIRNLKSWQLSDSSQLRVEISVPLVQGLAKSWRHSVSDDQLFCTYERPASVVDGSALQIMESREFNSIRVPIVNPNGVAVRVRVYESGVTDTLVGIAHVHIFQNELVSMPEARVPHFYQYKGYYDRRVLYDRDSKLSGGANETGEEEDDDDDGTTAGVSRASTTRAGSSHHSSSESSGADDDDDDNDGDNDDDDDDEEGSGNGSGSDGSDQGPALDDDDDVVRNLAEMGVKVKPRRTGRKGGRGAGSGALASAAEHDRDVARALAAEEGGGDVEEEAAKRRSKAAEGKYRGQLDEFGNPVLDLDNDRDQINTYADASAGGVNNKLLIQGFMQTHNTKNAAAAALSGGTLASSTASAFAAGTAPEPDGGDELAIDPPLSVPLFTGRQVGFSHVQSSLLQVNGAVQWRQAGTLRFYLTTHPIPDMRTPPKSALASDDALEEWRVQCQKTRKQILQRVRDVDHITTLVDKLYNQRFVSRVYVYEGKNLSPRESFFTGNQSVNPFLVVSNAPGPDYKVNNRDSARENDINPEFFQVYEMPTELPLNHVLDIAVWNKDNIAGDELIGTISVDVEELILSRRTHGTGAFYSLFTDQSVLSQGKLKMKIDILTEDEARRVRADDLMGVDPAEYELRMVIWNTRDVRMPEEKDKDNEVDQKMYVTANFNGEYGGDIIKSTDTAWFTSSGMAEWNWRMTWRLRLPCQVPRLKFSMWSDAVVGDSEAIGECNYSLSPFFELAMRDRRPISHRNQQWVPLTHPNFPDVLLGEICVEFWLLTAIEADKKPVGEAQDEPNEDPFLPNPHRNPPPWAVGSRGLQWLAKRKALIICVCLLVIVVPIVIAVLVIQSRKKK